MKGLTTQQLDEIRASGETNAALAKRYACSEDTIRRWRHGREPSRTRLSREAKEEILASKETCRALADRYGVSFQAVNNLRIRNGQRTQRPRADKGKPRREALIAAFQADPVTPAQ